MQHLKSPMNLLKRVAKRAMDVGIALAVLPVAVPLGAATGALISFETPGGPIFRQTRVGRDGREFTVYKLRTMVNNAEKIGAGLYADQNDPRFTRVGVFARRFSLDELPQLWNVIRGEMSIVGPRPQHPVTINEYREQYDEILRVKPGLTGLAQVSGRNALPRSKRLALDREYARTWTVTGDVRILLRTLTVVVDGEGQLNHGVREDVET